MQMIIYMNMKWDTIFEFRFKCQQMQTHNETEMATSIWFVANFEAFHGLFLFPLT